MKREIARRERQRVLQQQAAQATPAQVQSLAANLNALTVAAIPLQSAEVIVPGHGASRRHGGHQPFYPTAPSHGRGRSIARYGGHHPSISEQSSQMPGRPNALRQSRYPHGHGGRYRHYNSRHNGFSAQTTRQEQVTGHIRHGQNTLVPIHQATFAGTMIAFPQQAGPAMPLAPGANRPVRYLVQMPVAAQQNQLSGYNYVVPVTTETIQQLSAMQQFGYSFAPVQANDGVAPQHHQSMCRIARRRKFHDTTSQPTWA